MAEENSEQLRWKSKYLETLDKLEVKEDANQQLLRNLGRLALISQGIDPALDQYLDNLRRSLKKDENADSITNIVEKISQHVKLLDERQRAAKIGTPEELLLALVDHVSVPSFVKPEWKKLRKSLVKPDDATSLDELVEEFSAIIAKSLQGEEVVEGEAAAEKKKGLLGRLFGKDEAPATQEIPDVTEGEARAHYAPNVPSAVDFGPVFIDVIDGLIFPQNFEGRIDNLKAKVARGVSHSTVKPVTHELIALIVEANSILEQERNDLENFLKLLIGHLQELDAMVEGAESNRLASLEGGRHLSDAVKAQVDDIENAVQTAHEPGQMKQLIQQSLDQIRQHFAEQRGEEEVRQQAIEVQLMAMAKRLHELETETRRLQDRLLREREQAMTDPLTGAPNRLAYDKRIVQEYSRWQRYGAPLTMVLCDVDHFKNINDVYGHKAGDRALKAIAQSLQQHIRASDFFARVGGEEFVVLLPETTIGDAKTVAEKLRKGVEACTFVYQGNPVAVTISGGIAQFQKGDTVDAVYQRADKALYRAKEQGRNQFQNSL